MTFNVRGIKNSGEELEYYPNLAKPYILALQEKNLGFRYNKGEISRMIDHIFYSGLSRRENWCNANKYNYISDHILISADYDSD
ncbi:hypothetical protein AYI68_g1624 [Smittium mucronatum]|uniref:Endonuclease/exonuclease/phosphatase domain-containing protein n=1 Tax=Smittium mucronatum TaxID=133383 RepID=A0A1R0H505_9FUNG|nr:hypothetical protein AYI68_g1624 [Smittium mucronatum]